MLMLGLRMIVSNSVVSSSTGLSVHLYVYVINVSHKPTTRNLDYTRWLKIKYPTRQYAISPQTVVWFYKFLKLLNPDTSLNLTVYNVSSGVTAPKITIKILNKSSMKQFEYKHVSLLWWTIYGHVHYIGPLTSIMQRLTIDSSQSV